MIQLIKIKVIALVTCMIMIHTHTAEISIIDDTLNTMTSNTLDLDGCNLDDTAICLLAKKIKKRQDIINVQLGSNIFGDIGFAALLKVVPKTSIAWLGVSDNKITDAGIEYLNKYLAYIDCALCCITLDGNLITDTGKRELLNFLRIRPTAVSMGLDHRNALRAILSERYLPRNTNSDQTSSKILIKSSSTNDISKITISALDRALVKKIELNSLWHLNLSEHDLDDTMIHNLSDMIRGKFHITKLTLDDNKFGDDGFIPLTKALAYTSIHELSAKNNNITDEGARILASFLKHNHSKMTLIDLTSNLITETGKKVLVSSSHNSKTRIVIGRALQKRSSTHRIKRKSASHTATPIIQPEIVLNKQQRAIEHLEPNVRPAHQNCIVS